MVCPSDLPSSSAKTRATMSAVAPGASGTIMRIGLAGQACAMLLVETTARPAVRKLLFVRTMAFSLLESDRFRDQGRELLAQARDQPLLRSLADQVFHFVGIALQVVEFVACDSIE